MTITREQHLEAALIAALEARAHDIHHELAAIAAELPDFATRPAHYGHDGSHAVNESHWRLVRGRVEWHELIDAQNAENPEAWVIGRAPVALAATDFDNLCAMGVIWP